MHIEVQFDKLVFPEHRGSDEWLHRPRGADADRDILLVDHKTTARQPSSSFEIGFNEQRTGLRLGAVQEVRRQPHRIALDYVRFDRLVDAPFDMERAEAAIARQEAAVRGVRSGVFIKQNPTSFHQQCHNKFLKRTCAYLSHCHPDYAAYIKGAITMSSQNEPFRTTVYLSRATRRFAGLHYPDDQTQSRAAAYTQRRYPQRHRDHRKDGRIVNDWPSLDKLKYAADVVAEYTGVHVEALLHSKRRLGRIMSARKMLVMVCRKYSRDAVR
jgi:hypothetical protein